MTCSRPVHNLFMIFSCLLHDLLMTSQPVPDTLVVHYLRLAQDLFTIFSWLIHDLYMACSCLYGLNLSIASLWLFHDFLMIYSWLVPSWQVYGITHCLLMTLAGHENNSSPTGRLEDWGAIHIVKYWMQFSTKYSYFLFISCYLWLAIYYLLSESWNLLLLAKTCSFHSLL